MLREAWSKVASMPDEPVRKSADPRKVAKGAEASGAVDSDATGATGSDHSANAPRAAAREIALRRLSVRARSRKELAQDLKSRDVSPEVADELLNRFAEVGLIDDAAFAEEWVESRGHRSGAARLRQELRLKGVADEHIADMDVIVTATSGAGKKVLDIMKVKPGAVITDVARPLDLSVDDVAKRPDVLVIESGEIELPGDPQMKGIGLPKGVAYACLAETIVLALEGRYETFTVGRNIEWEKVKEIYRLGLKHGMKLAAISGVNGVYTDSDLAKIRELALAKREEMAAAES